MRKTVTIYNNNEQLELDFPAKHEVCRRCEGHGTHLNPSIGEHAYTPEEFHQEFDEEGREEYFKHGGIYDVQCHTCKGKNVTLEIDEDNLNAEEKANLELYHKHLEEERYFQSECEAELRWGC